MERRGILKAFLATVAAAWSAQRAVPAEAVQAAPAGVAQTKHIRLYVEMDIAPAREREMLDLFHNQFVPEAVKHEGYIRVKMLKRRSIAPGHRSRSAQLSVRARVRERRAPAEVDCLAGHARVWPPVEKTMTTQTNYPVVLYDEV